MRLAAALVVLAAVAAHGRPAAAHPLDLGYLRLEADGDRLAVALDLDAAAAARLAAEPAALAAATLHGAPFATERGPCQWGDGTASRTGRTVTIASRAVCPPGARTLRWAPPFVADARISPRFQLLIKARWSGDEQVTTLDRSAPVLELGARRALGFAEFVWSGVEHIGAAPDQWRDAGGWRLPDGLDHILFLVALLLAGGTLLQLAAIATGFTLGHSITLALSALGVVRPPASLIEPLIALTIAFVAAQAMLGRATADRWRIAACFGLVHGFGFAGALGELDLSARDAATALAGYNAGVELGQLAIVLAAAPIVLALQRRPRAHRAVARIAGAAIFVAGAYWFGRRLVG